MNCRPFFLNSLYTISGQFIRYIIMQVYNVQFLLTLSEMYTCNYMFIIEVTVKSGAVLNCIILKSVSNSLYSIFIYMGQNIRNTSEYRVVQYNILNSNDLNA